MLMVSESEARDALSLGMAAEIIRSTYKRVGEGRIHASTPSRMNITGLPHRLGAKGAVLTDLDVAGIRLTSRAASRLMLWSLESGAPIMMMDESHNFRFRTGVSAAVVAGYLLRKGNLLRVAIIGAGPIAREITLAIAGLLKPSEILVASRRLRSAQALADTVIADGVRVKAVAEVDEAVQGADLVVTITSANEVLIRRELLADDATVLSMGGGLEVDHDVWAAADTRLVDDLDYALLQGDAAAWISSGVTDQASFKSSLTGTIGDLAANRIEIPSQSRGLTMAIVQGTTALDLALAHAVYLAMTSQSQTNSI